MEQDTKHIVYGEDGWTITESHFSPHYLGKWESIFCQGSGYLGIRNALEEQYVEEHRGMFVAGTFDRADKDSAPELPNLPDLTAVSIFLDGERFALTEQNQENYYRTMNYETGETVREVCYHTLTGKRVRFRFRRFVSLVKKHTFADSIEIEPLDEEVELKIESGIDARTTNTGVQHIVKLDSRIYEHKYMQTVGFTRESDIAISLQCAHRLSLDGKDPEQKIRILPYIRNRRNIQIFTLNLPKGSHFRFQKLASVRTSRDKSYLGMSKEAASTAAKKDGLAEIKERVTQGYDILFEESKNAWKKFWENSDVQIESRQPFDQLALRFAIYHLNIMNYPEDNRMGVGAKGLSGEEYSGHSFWDTEIFLMPYYLFTNPKAARALLEYRYYILDGARKKASRYGCKGAMYPWEAAWITDEETCVDMIGVDVETGKPMRVLCGEIELHITADIAYAVWQYQIATKDTQFMENFGAEMLLETARFWTSRAQWKEEKKHYEILDVIGPDEYKENVDNNAYTNYMAYYNMKLALEILDTLTEEKYKELEKKLGSLSQLKGDLENVSENLYLPVGNEHGIIPQNDSYLNLKELNLEKYKNAAVPGSIHEEYSMERLKEYQVSKQGDLVVLMYLLEDLFDAETKRLNYLYYEKHTLHDSSLSKCTHSILANDLNLEEAYPFFEGAAKIDAGENMKSSDNGVHSASCGGIWQCAVMGFGGIRMVGDKLRIAPHLPKAWTSLRFQIYWEKCPMKLHITSSAIQIENKGNHSLSFQLMGEDIRLDAGETLLKPL